MTQTDYTWVDKMTHTARTLVLKRIASLMNASGAAWTTDKVKAFRWNSAAFKQAVFEESYNKIIREDGYTDDDCSIPVELRNFYRARAQQQTRKFYDFCKLFDNDITCNANRIIMQPQSFQLVDYIDVTDGVVKLRSDWEKNLLAACTHVLPKEYQKPYKIIKENEAAFVAFSKLVRDPMINNCFSGDKLSPKDFYESILLS